jgi:hypothetical protein
METATMDSANIDPNTINLATMSTATNDIAIWISQKWTPQQ